MKACVIVSGGRIGCFASVVEPMVPKRHKKRHDKFIAFHGGRLDSRDRHRIGSPDPPHNLRLNFLHGSPQSGHPPDRAAAATPITLQERVNLNSHNASKPHQAIAWAPSHPKSPKRQTPGWPAWTQGPLSYALAKGQAHEPRSCAPHHRRARPATALFKQMATSHAHQAWWERQRHSFTVSVQMTPVTDNLSEIRDQRSKVNDLAFGCGHEKQKNHGFSFLKESTAKFRGL